VRALRRGRREKSQLEEQEGCYPSLPEVSLRHWGDLSDMVSRECRPRLELNNHRSEQQYYLLLTYGVEQARLLWALYAGGCDIVVGKGWVFIYSNSTSHV
jgi:hypothetical protein